MGKVLDLAERYWDGRVVAEERSPFTPLLELEEVLPRTAFVSSFANVTALDTDDGLVLIDTGSVLLAEQVHDQVRAWSSAPLHTAVFTHGHIDHCFGVELYDADAAARAAPKPRVIAHAALPARFDRYRLTRGYNACINARQFQTDVEWPATFRYPDETYERDRVVDVGGLRIELHHARGETDDATWAYVPTRKLLLTGDLFIWATPNAGNPQKVQRYPADWAAALRAMAACDAETMCPGHGFPILGKERVRRALTETAELLESIVAQTIARMNDGEPLDAIVHGVKAPPALLERPYLKPVYDEPEFIVRNVVRLLGGWWDGDPSQLKPAPRADVAREIAALSGGPSRLVARAEELATAGDHRLACHLIEIAHAASPGDAPTIEARARVYTARARAETSLMARGVFRAAAKGE